MAMTNDADETDSLDLNILLHELKEVVQEDGVTTEEALLVERFEFVVSRYSKRVRLRLALESLLRSGVNRYTKTKANDAGMVVVAMNGEVIDLVPHDPNFQIDPREPYGAAVAA